MAGCVYDNPDTCAREWYQDGVLVGSIQEVVFASKTWPRDLRFMASFDPGRLVGDPSAMRVPNDD